MKCINCNLEISDDAKVCKHCGTNVITDVIRCPRCFVKLEKGIKKCTKCGCDIEKALYEEKEPEHEKLKLTKKRIIIVASAAVLLLAVIALVFGLWYSNRFNAFKEDAKDFVSMLEENAETVNMLADKYNNVYNGQWLIHTELSGVLEDKYKKEISSLKNSRDTLTYLTNELAEKCVNDEDASLVRKVFKNYDSCYIYVVGKNGKYPGYMNGYEKLFKEYEKNMKALKKRIK